MREQAGTWIACLVLVGLVAMSAKGDPLTMEVGPEDLKTGDLLYRNNGPTKPLLARIPEPVWRQMPMIEPGTFESRLVLPDPLSVEIRRGGSEYRITDSPADPGHVEIRERFGELIGVRVGKGCSVEVVDHDRKGEE